MRSRMSLRQLLFQPSPMASSHPILGTRQRCGAHYSGTGKSCDTLHVTAASTRYGGNSGYHWHRTKGP